jgi:serine/threonine protein kinase
MLQHWPQGLQLGIVTSIKGANILVDNKGCIKLADFGASKKWLNLQPFLKPSLLMKDYN